MGEWSFLGDLLEAVNAHSTMTGRLWLMIFIIFRVLVIATIGDNLYEDEQEAFICNTLQPGCNQVCYDKAFPMSHFRFWVFQIVVLAAPSLSFIAFAIHSQTKEEKAERIVEKKPFQSMEEQKKWEKSRSNREARRHAMYAVHVVLKLVLEIGCLVSQYFVYGFTINAHFPCERFPCPNKVDCFVSRPTEKNVFLLYYFVVNVFSALLCFVEINLIGLKTLRRRLKHVVDTDSDEEYHHAPPSFSSAVTFTSIDVFCWPPMDFSDPCRASSSPLSPRPILPPFVSSTVPPITMVDCVQCERRSIYIQRETILTFL